MSDCVELDIEKIVFGAKGLARLDGQVIFIPGTLPGERVLARIQHEHKDYSDAELVNVISPAVERQAPGCPLVLKAIGTRPPFSEMCVGCSYQHLPYPFEVQLKQAQFEDLLSKHPSTTETVVHPAIASPKHSAYRNKITLKASNERGEVALGYVQQDNKTIIGIETCPLAVPEINTLLHELRSKPGFLHALRDDMKITLRWTEQDGALYWRGKDDPKGSWLKEETPAGQLSVPRGSFFQVNTEAAGLLFDRVTDLLAGRTNLDTVLDLFCGVGVFGMLAAKNGIPNVRGIDSDPIAIQAAEYNAKTLRLKVEFETGKSGSALSRISEGIDPTRTCVVVDPPRTGLDPRTIDNLGKLSSQWILYVSCAADTMVRDVVRLAEHGYTMEETQLIDMFPRTAHFESITLLHRP